jgi:hypothetical protein
MPGNFTLRLTIILRIFVRMLLPKITGKMLRAGRVFADLTQEQLAARAGINRDCLRGWEGSSDSTVPCQYRTLCSAIEVLEAEGVRFSENGVSLIEARATPIATVIHSEVRQ